jgi:hypothetical protein
VLPVNIQGIVLKVHSHFLLCIVRVEHFKEFCEFLNQEYKKILGFSKTRWLALLLAVERLLNMLLPVISFFESLDKVPFVIKAFFENPLSEAWPHFGHNQASIFHAAIEKVQRQKISFISYLYVKQSEKQFSF